MRCVTFLTGTALVALLTALCPDVALGPGSHRR